MRTLQITTIFSILVLLSGTAVAADWPMFGHDPQHTGVAGESLEPPLEVLWKFGTGDEVGPPAVSGGTVYIGSRDEYVYALDADTGTEKWKFETGGWTASSPAVSGDTIYISCSWDDYVYALDADTGTEKWKFETGGRTASSPAVYGGTVYIGSGDHYLDFQTCGEKHHRPTQLMYDLSRHKPPCRQFLQFDLNCPYVF